ncbi:hypothetical protein [Mesorhizobium sp. KR1-2]|uniref:beta strand repeat-containing protein n=1 Tax=Mesorhizobium sp. KR1-2 TaxID=3156609 RepID=UPI0032B49C70
MSKLNLSLATAIALALLMGGAHADSNFANVKQNGSSNSGVVTQGLSSHNGSHNKVGTEVGAAYQDGSNNDLDISQSGSSNEVGTTGKGFDQSGNRNRATIIQSSNKNIVGEVQQIDLVKSGSAVRNTLTILQQGGDNNSIDSVRQTRTNGLLTNNQAGNSAIITQGGIASGDRSHIVTLSQTGRANSATVTQSSSNNDLAALRQNGSQNKATLVQEVGNGNKVGTIDQDGAGNEASLSFTGAGNGVASFDPGQLSGFSAFGGLRLGNVRQTGLGNHINFVVTGDGTAFGFSQNGIGNSIYGLINGDDNQIGVGQDGTANHANVLVGLGDKNDIYIDQISGAVSFGNDADVRIAGDSNTVSSLQTSSALGRNVLKADIAGLQNELKANQSISGGGTNSANVLFKGNNNHLDITQAKSGFGSGNTLNVTLYGNYNNDAPGFSSPVLTHAVGLARSIAGGSSLSFGPGTIYQSGNGNTITLDVGTATTNSNGNLFAFVQSGNTNGIVGSINGMGNQAVVVQSGDGNFTNFSQIGNFNVVGVSQ